MLACDAVVMGTCAKALAKTVAWRARRSRPGVRPRVEPRKPMRSARVVSRVTRTTFGRSAAEAGSAVRKKRKKVRCRMERRGIRILTQTPPPRDLAGPLLELQAQRPLERPRAALRDHGVPLIHVGSRAELSERAAADAARGSAEV